MQMHKEWCLFCWIAKWTISTPGVFRESDTHMAFLGIFPNTEWMTVVIPKAHFDSDCMHMPPDELTELTLVAQTVATILENAFDDVGRVGVVMEWTWVDHAHIKLYPMHQTEWMKNGTWEVMEAAWTERFDAYPGYLTTVEGKRVDDDSVVKLASKLKSMS